MLSEALADIGITARFFVFLDEQPCGVNACELDSLSGSLPLTHGMCRAYLISGDHNLTRRNRYFGWFSTSRPRRQNAGQARRNTPRVR